VDLLTHLVFWMSPTTVLIGSQDNTSYKVIRLYKIRFKMNAIKLIRYYLTNFLYDFSVYAL
jgi:hypothetical protein